MSEVKPYDLSGEGTVSMSGDGRGSDVMSSAAAKGRSHNILLVLTDQQRFDAVGYANPEVRTPHLDGLASEGCVFSHAYSTSPSCVPARAALATGRYPSQCGAPTFVTYANDDETTFMSVLRKHGYYTAVIGKQHFGSSGIERGYDYEDIIDQHYLRADRRSSYATYLERAGFGHPSELSRPVDRFTEEWITDIRHHIDHYVGDRATQWLTEKRPGDRPWHLCVSFPGPHQPFDCLNTSYADRYRLDDIALPATSRNSLASKPPHYRATPEYDDPPSDDEIRKMRLAYYANISLIDDKLGELVEALKNGGEYDNTLILVTSDHGDFMGDYGLVHKGQYLAEVLMRVPMVIKPPDGLPSAHRTTGLVSTVDVAGTFLAAAGVDVPPAMVSRDLSSCWRQSEETVTRPYVFMEAGALRGIRTGEWKLVHYSGRSYGELYNLATDPWEQHNLWDNSNRAATKAKLYALMVTEMTVQSAKADAVWNVGSPKI